MEFLQTRDYLLEVQEDKQLSRMLAVIQEDKKVEYAFKAGRLFATSLTKNFEDKKEIKERIDNCLRYLEIISKGNVVKTTEGKKTCHTAVTTNRIIKFFVIPMKNDACALQLTAVSRRFGDLKDEEKFFYEIEILQKKLSAEK